MHKIELSLFGLQERFTTDDGGDEGRHDDDDGGRLEQSPQRDGCGRSERVVRRGSVRSCRPARRGDSSGRTRAYAPEWLRGSAPPWLT